MSFYAKAWCRANIVTVEPTRVYVSEPGYGVINLGRRLCLSWPKHGAGPILSLYAKDQAWCRANIVTIEPTRVYVSQSGHRCVDPGRGLCLSMPRFRPGVGSILSLYSQLEFM